MLFPPAETVESAEFTLSRADGTGVGGSSRSLSVEGCGGLRPNVRYKRRMMYGHRSCRAHATVVAENARRYGTGYICGGTGPLDLPPRTRPPAPAFAPFLSVGRPSFAFGLLSASD